MPGRVLIVEDDDDLRDNLALLLELRGHKVDTAQNGQQALSKIGKLGPPSLIILDLMMPGMNGWQLRAALLRNPDLASVPVVLLSGVADVQEAARELSAVDHLKKPIDLDKLYKVVDTYC